MWPELIRLPRLVEEDTGELRSTWYLLYESGQTGKPKCHATGLSTELMCRSDNGATRRFERPTSCRHLRHRVKGEALVS